MLKSRVQDPHRDVVSGAGQQFLLVQSDGAHAGIDHAGKPREAILSR
jgi:hypothetical protein